MDTLFTIILPTYNRPNVLDTIIGSVLKQSYTNWELLIVDDSTKSEEDRILNLQDSRIKYFHRGEKLGVSSARNYGSNYALGSYLIFLDDDDDVEVSWLSDFHQVIASRSGIDLICCTMKIIVYPGAAPKLVEPYMVDEYSDLTANVIPGAFCLRKDFFTTLGGYDASLRYSENTELFFRIVQSNPIYQNIDKANFIYFQSVDGGSKNLVNMRHAIEVILNKHADFLNKNRKNKQMYLRVAGVVSLRLGDIAAGRKFLWKAFRNNPFDMYTLIRLAIALTPFISKKIYLLKS